MLWHAELTRIQTVQSDNIDIYTSSLVLIQSTVAVCMCVCVVHILQILLLNKTFYKEISFNNINTNYTIIQITNFIVQICEHVLSAAPLFIKHITCNISSLCSQHLCSALCKTVKRL